MNQRLRPKNVSRKCFDAVIIKANSFDLIFVVDFGKCNQEIMADVNVFQFGVVCELYTAQLIVVQVDLADTWHDISLKLMYTVIGKIELLKRTQVHKAKLIQFVLT